LIEANNSRFAVKNDCIIAIRSRTLVHYFGSGPEILISAAIHKLGNASFLSCGTLFYARFIEDLCDRLRFLDRLKCSGLCAFPCVNNSNRFHLKGIRV
jgi:hypothetical protein